MTQALALSPRLEAVASLVPEGARLADIGTDHAYLPAWLLKEGKITHAIAADLREGPLNRARETAAFYGLTERISFRLCDGLKEVSPDEVDTIVIAGMGGETIAEILAAAQWTKRGEHKLLLQPMSSQEDLRRWLSMHGYRIVEEHLAREGKTLYTIMAVVGGAVQQLSDLECVVGCFSTEEPELGAYLSEHLARLDRRICGLARAKHESAQEQCADLKRLYFALEAKKKEWETWQL